MSFIRTYYGSFAEVLIYVLGRSEPVRLWVPDNPWVTGLTVNTESRVIRSFSLSIDLPFQEGIEIIEGKVRPPLFQASNRIAARIGWSDTGEMTQWYSGLIQNGGQQISITPDGITGTIEAVPFGSIQDSESSHKFPDDVTAAAVVNWAVEQIGASIFYDGDQESAIKASLLNYHYKKGFVVGNRSPLLIFKDAVDKAGLDFWDAPLDKPNAKPGFVLTNSELTGQAPPLYTLAMRGRFDASKRQLPLMEFAPESTPAVWRYAEPPIERGAKSAYYDSDTGKLEKLSVKAADVVGQVGGAQMATTTPQDVNNAGAQVNRKPGKDGAGLRTADTSQEKLEAKAKKGGAYGIPATLTTVGIPEELAGQRVQVIGCGGERMFDGLWRVFGQTQTFGSDGWTTQLSVKKDGVPENPAGSEASSAGQNTKKVDKPFVPGQPTLLQFKAKLARGEL